MEEEFLHFFNKEQRIKVVQQFSLEGKFINEYKSVSETSNLTGCNKTSIAKVCRGKCKVMEGINNNKE